MNRNEETLDYKNCCCPGNSVEMDKTLLCTLLR